LVLVNEPLVNGREKELLAECIDTGWISSEGPFVKQFEKSFSAMVHREYGVAVANGSAALDVAAAAVGIGAGDEVIMPAFTIISPAASVVRLGGVPVLVDSMPDTWNMDVSQIEAKITNKTKAIIVVHIYGLPVDMNPVLELARKYGLRVIEDAAEMHGQTYYDRPCGSLGDISIFSFYPNKHITTGEGGMVVTDSEELAERCRSFRNLCFQPQKRFVHEELGWNYRMTNMQAALGIAQMERLDEFVGRKRRMGKIYSECLQDIASFQLPLQKTDYALNIYWVYGLVLRDTIQFDAAKAMKKLAEHNIGTRPFFWCMHEQPVFRNMGLFEGESYPVAEKLARRGFYIPSGMALTDSQIEEVCTKVREVFLDI